MLGPRLRRQRTEVGTLAGRVGLAPAGLPVGVVAGRVEIAVLLRAPHEAELREPLLAGPRLPVEALGRPAYGGTRPVADHGPGDGPVPHELTQGLDAVEQAVLADAVQRDHGAAAGLAHGEAVAPGRQIGAFRRAQGPQGVAGVRAAEPEHRPPAGQGVVHRAHAGVAQEGPERLHRVRIGLRAGQEGDLRPQGDGPPRRLRGLRAGPDRRQWGVTGAVRRCRGGGDGGRHGGRHERAEQPADHGDGDGRRMPPAPELHAVPLRPHSGPASGPGPRSERDRCPGNDVRAHHPRAEVSMHMAVTSDMPDVLQGVECGCSGKSCRVAENHAYPASAGT